ncbi:MAG: alkaline phosphatase family protein [Deltaproteobacteria bacterium]|nr:alkaline phosphatase family protein [Deltaproteobacteria bacterium]
MDASKKTLVIGLDGVPCTLLNDYLEKGILPNLKEILSQGYSLRQMDASIPDVSSTSWTSFMTGVNPGEHGIFGFMELRPNTYKMAFPNLNDVQAPPVWDILGNTVNNRSSSLYDKFNGKVPGGFRSIVLNIPQTFPAPAMNGILTAGFVCPDLRKGTYPESAYDYLKSVGYMPDVDAAKAASAPEAFFDEVFLSLDRRAEAYMHFLESESWDLFIGVITETDRLHHFFFDAALDPGNRFHEKFMLFYKKADEVIGRLFNRFMEATGGKGLFMTMSDHGFTVIDKEVYINNFLRESGFLNVNGSREYFEQIDSGTRAFAMDPARIYINLEGKYPFGAVKDSGREKAVAEIKEALGSLTRDGRPVVKSIFEKSELYSGPAAIKGPDLVCLAHDGFDLKGNMKRQDVFGNSHFRGMHTRHDAHCLLPGSIGAPGRLHIESLAEIILSNYREA